CVSRVLHVVYANTLKYRVLSVTLNSLVLSMHDLNLLPCTGKRAYSLMKNKLATVSDPEQDHRLPAPTWLNVKLAPPGSHSSELGDCPKPEKEDGWQVIPGLCQEETA